ncbi:hypothetical protein GGX14DRAFT_437463 [Mycena pura]|uniref:Uncharacterized protein n=1 Tax=Mycena pura TaxID=153505 RepID=A0AAD6VSH8_9AGAR|nr:hypothetical protein GGX14DRAFT_437463 [Mycena pura]
MSNELYEDLFGPDSPPTSPSSVAAAPGHGESERDETPEATDADGVDNPQVPVEDTAKVVIRSGTRCPSTLATPPGRALGGAAELAGSPSSPATPPVASGVAGQAFEPVLPVLPLYPRVNGAQRGASLPRQLNASRPLAPSPQHAYRQAAPPFFQGHGGHGGYASAPHIPPSNGLPYTGPTVHHAFNPAAYASALRTGSLAPASGSRAFPGAAQLSYPQAQPYSQNTGQFYGTYPMDVTGPRSPNRLHNAILFILLFALTHFARSPLYAGQEGGWGGATTACRQPVPADSWGDVFQNQNFTPAATGNCFNGGTANAYYRNNVASHGAQQALAQGVSQPNFASTSNARAPQAQNVGVTQPSRLTQDHSASGKKRLQPDSDPDFGVPPDVQPDAGLATHYGSVVAPNHPPRMQPLYLCTKREPGEKRQTAKDKKLYLDPKFLESLSERTVKHLKASRLDGEENLYECKLPLHPDAADLLHELLDAGTLHRVRKHLWLFHGGPNPSRKAEKAGSAKGEPAPKIRCQWSSEPDGAQCGKVLNETNMAQHVISCHVLSDCFRCPMCKAVGKDRMELARHMKVCEYWNKGLVKGAQPFMRPAKIARRDGEEDISGAGADVQTA